MTIKAKLERARKIIDCYGLSERFSKDHVEEIGVLTGTSLENICRVKNPKTGKDDRFLAVRFVGDDENHIGFSWNKRISGKHGDQDYRAKEVFRKTISHQLFSFKVDALDECYFCGASSDDLHVDHCWPPFSMAMEGWIEKNGMPELVKQKDGCGHAFKNEFDERSWQSHHYNNQSLQMLCSKCNLRKSNNQSLTMMSLWLLSMLAKEYDFTSESATHLDPNLDTDTPKSLVESLMNGGRLLNPTGPICKRYE